MSGSPGTVSQLLASIRDVGRDRLRGGHSRFTYTPAHRELVEWFVAESAHRSMEVVTDRNGVMWAWREGSSGSLQDAVVTGSHLDSVPGGGEFDGPLGVASAFIAVDLLDARGVESDRALAVVAFPEEEGGRFGQACLGSKLMTGALDADRARNLLDLDGVTLAEALAGAGIDPAHIGRDDEAVSRMGAFVELHVEQGRGLVHLDAPVAVGTSIIGHGLWRLTITGEGNHAGATSMQDRRDPMVVAGAVILAVRRAAQADSAARATVGRVQSIPAGTNVIPSRVHIWIDARHPDDNAAWRLVDEIYRVAQAAAVTEGCVASIVMESYGGSVALNPELRDRIASALPSAPHLATGAGHDAGVLAERVPTAMLFTRNPTGISHSPDEQIDEVDAEAGAAALADALQELLRSETMGVGA